MNDPASAVAARPRLEAGNDPARMLARMAPIVFLLLWSSGFAVAKVGLRYTEPFTFLTLRYALIVLLVGPACLIVRPKRPARRVAWLHMVVVGFFIQCVYFGLAYAGLSAGVSAGVSALITSMQPLAVALAAPWVTGERIGSLRWLGFLLGAAGVVLVVVASSTLDARVDSGLLLCFLSMIGMSAATLYQKRFAVEAHPLTVNLVHYAVGLVAIAPVAYGFETMRIVWTPQLVAAVVWIALANSVVAISLLLFMISRSEAARVSALFFLVPPMAAVFGWLLVGETLSLFACGGMVLAAAGVWLSSRSG